MSTLEQYPVRPEFAQLDCLGRHLVQAGGLRLAQQNRGLGQVRGDDVGLRDEPPHRLDSVVVQ